MNLHIHSKKEKTSVAKKKQNTNLKGHPKSTQQVRNKYFENL